MFTKFADIFAELAGRGARKRMIAAWAVDGHTIAAASGVIMFLIILVFTFIQMHMSNRRADQ